ncbi:MAG: methyltransferase [Candidatus Bathyarchaeota archaeon]|nr:methyltransferase [Candidatus Bathyarchaeota archaeon]
MGLVYEPAEDSLLLLRHVEERVSGSILDMGTGSGVHAVAAATRPEVTRVVAVDIKPDAVEEAQRRAAEAGVSGKIEFLVSDLFQGLTGGWFDWIVFNPPYLPSEGEADEASWSGGRTGGEVIERFLSGAAGHLKAGGGILLVCSTLTGLDLGRWGERYRVEVLEEIPLFFERLLCLLLRPLSPS